MIASAACRRRLVSRLRRPATCALGRITMRGTRFLTLLSLVAAGAWLSPAAGAGHYTVAYDENSGYQEDVDPRVLGSDQHLQNSLSGGYDGAGGYGCGGAAHEPGCGCNVCAQSGGCECCYDPCCRSTGLVAGAE